MNETQSRVYTLDRLNDRIESALDELRLKSQAIRGVIAERTQRLQAAQDTIRDCKGQLLSGSHLLIEPDHVLHPDVMRICDCPTEGL